MEAWGDPVTTWRHHAQIKIPAGMDTEVVLEEGARLHERAAEQAPGPVTGRCCARPWTPCATRSARHRHGWRRR